MDEKTPPIKSFQHTGAVAAGIGITLTLLIILQHNLSFKGTIILPAGGTYLGPSTTTETTPVPTTPPITVTATPKTSQPSKAPSFETDASLVTVKGNKYPYSFQAPKTLKLVTLPNDQFDIYAISINNQPPDQNVLIGVDDLRRTEELKKYIGLSKRTYVENWWKQFGGLKGVASLTEFTNSQGLKGYKVKYLNSANQTPTDDVFFETPESHFVIHLANGPLGSTVFSALVDSVAWNK